MERVQSPASAAPLGDCPVVLHVAVAWGEMDAYGHVNNAVFFRWFESARIAYLDRIEFRDPAANDGVGPILAATSCRFRRPLFYPDQLHVGARVIDVADDRFTMQYRIFSTRLGEIAAEGGGVVVAYSYQESRKAGLPDAVRQRIAAVEAAAG
jgi:acyl-CoA thioester hydrolase